MFRDAIRRFYEEYYSSVDFRHWQNNFACDVYKELKPYVTPAKLKEVPKVRALCEAMSDRHYKGLRIESRMIHGYGNSGVEFDYMGEKSCKELADMAVVSLVTFCGDIVFLKTAFIQNKDSKDTPDKWNIDQEQLFLLKNFPTFTGTRGIFRGREFTFLNHSGTLGNFGLFSSKCETAFLTARNTFCNQQSNGVITFENVKNGAIAYNPQFATNTYFRRCGRNCDWDCMDCKHCNSLKCGVAAFGTNLPFFGNYRYALDVHEIVREFTYFNIGEISMAFRRVIDMDLYRYTSELIKSMLGHNIGKDYFKRGDIKLTENIEGDGFGMNVIFAHLELGENGNL